MKNKINKLLITVSLSIVIFILLYVIITLSDFGQETAIWETYDEQAMMVIIVKTKTIYTFDCENVQQKIWYGINIHNIKSIELLDSKDSVQISYYPHNTEFLYSKLIYGDQSIILNKYIGCTELQE